MKTRITEKNITGRNIEEEVIRTFIGYAHIYIMFSSFASSEVKGVKGVIAPYGR
jgi:hypothetical protein